MDSNRFMIEQLNELAMIAAQCRAQGRIDQADHYDNYIQSVRDELDLAEKALPTRSFREVVVLTARLEEAHKVNPASARALRNVLTGTLTTLNRSTSELLKKSPSKTRVIGG
jgi:hypothetical protein